MSSPSSKQLPQPDDPSVLAWRYLDLPKLVSLLLKRELHLTRLDALEDKYEGTLPLHTREALLTELRPTITSEKAWPMVERAVHFGRLFRSPDSMKQFVERYVGAEPEGNEGNFAANFAMLMFYFMIQLGRIGAAAGLARMEVSGESPELKAHLNDTAFAEKLSETMGALPGNKVLLDLETNYERIPPEKRESTIQEVTDFFLAYMASRRQELFVNCWHLGNHESEAMWRIYCGKEDGVAIVLPYSRLRDSISEANTSIGKVKYIPYETEMLTSGWGNFSLAIHKRKEFEHEHEARIVGQPTAATGQLDTSIQMGWDPEQHLDRIVISPYSRPWYGEIVKGIVERIAPGLSGKVVQSSMSQPPFIPKQPEISAAWIACAKEMGYRVSPPDGSSG